MTKITGFAQDTASNTDKSVGMANAPSTNKLLHLSSFDVWLIASLLGCAFVLCYAIFTAGAKYGKNSVVDRISKSGFTYIEKTATSNGSTTMSIEIIENH